MVSSQNAPGFDGIGDLMVLSAATVYLRFKQNHVLGAVDFLTSLIANSSSGFCFVELACICFLWFGVFTFVGRTNSTRLRLLGGSWSLLASRAPTVDSANQCSA